MMTPQSTEKAPDHSADRESIEIMDMRIKRPDNPRLGNKEIV
jgi:hypothetical protein